MTFRWQMKEKAGQVYSHPLRSTLLHLQTDQEMVSKMTSKRLMKDFKCLAPLAGYIAKPNIANCIDKSLLWGCITFQLEIYDLPKCPISSI